MSIFDDTLLSARLYVLVLLKIERPPTCAAFFNVLDTKLFEKNAYFSRNLETICSCSNSYRNLRDTIETVRNIQTVSINILLSTFFGL